MEIWKDITGYEGLYQVSNYGNVKKKLDSKILNIYDNGIGYKFVSLKLNGKYKTHYLHRLVAYHFLKNLNNYLEVNHLDFDKSNNKVENLEWCSRKTNMSHYYNAVGTIIPFKKYTNYKKRNSFYEDSFTIDLYKPNKKYRLRVRINGERKHIGYFKTFELALEKQKSLSL